MGRPAKIVPPDTRSRAHILQDIYKGIKPPLTWEPVTPHEIQAFIVVYGGRSNGYFTAIPVALWSTQRVKDRLRWLKAQRLKLPTADVVGRQKNLEKIARYTKELFKRLSPAGVALDRKRYNRKRREDRAEAKKKRLRKMANAALARQRAFRKSMRNQGTSPATKTSESCGM
jgi:hypothetical protein